MERHPRRAAGDVEHRVKQRPVGDGIGSVAHAFRFAEGRRDAARIEVVASNGDRSGDLSRGDEVVDGDAELRAIGLAEPTDARGKTLELYFLLGERDPAAEMLVVRKKLQREVVGA